ncbi:DoxX family protein [Nocardia sp. AG03]|uniref:DoxX family protein n=1 Tax=Nocardia sp. AG03 TaxID=3025312 RepID=UPI0024184A05|nr:DoxX family protein [Nocardia sp. AG03]
MSVVVLIGRILFSSLFLGAGIGHLTAITDSARYAAGRGIPAPVVAVSASGAAMIVAATSVLLGVWGDLGSLVLVAFLVPTAFLMHAFWKESDAETRQHEMVHFNKDIALAGAALVFFAVFAGAGEVGLTLTGPAFTWR